MAVSLQKGGNVSLSKEAPGLTEVTVGLGWDARVTDGSKFDLDASIFILGESGQVLDDASFIFYNNKNRLTVRLNTWATTSPAKAPVMTSKPTSS